MSAEWVVDVTDQTFEKEVLERSHELPVVVDFWAEWCGPCKVLGPTLEKLAAEYNGKFLLAKVNTDQAQQLARVFGIRSIPTVIGFKNGEPAGEFSGAIPEESVRKFLARLSPSEIDIKVESADRLRADDPDQAASLYREVLEDTPGHDGARVGLAEALLATGEDDEARTIVDSLWPPSGTHAERLEHLRSELSLRGLSPDVTEDRLRSQLEENPTQGSVLLQLGQLLAAEKRYPEALESLLRAAELDRKLAEGKAKTMMVDIFHVIGVRSGLADDFRTKLSRLLY
ncbi:MAG: thioredoxin [Acidobacteriota bacterium]|nr:MAG: thioredoxin [Acidobacteriota bacterium]